MVVDASVVAESLIGLSYEKQDPISNLKLQKLLYYAQAWHLALLNSHFFATILKLGYTALSYPLFLDVIEISSGVPLPILTRQLFPLA